MPALVSTRFTPSAPRVQRQSVASLLLKRYLAGMIADAQWRQIESGLEAAGTDPSEREAYAAFCLDAISRGEDISHAPEGEMGELLSSIR